MCARVAARTLPGCVSKTVLFWVVNKDMQWQIAVPSRRTQANRGVASTVQPIQRAVDPNHIRGCYIANVQGPYRRHTHASYSSGSSPSWQHQRLLLFHALKDQQGLFESGVCSSRRVLKTENRVWGCIFLLFQGMLENTA